MELMQASKQWATRPDDERFSNLKEMHDNVIEYYKERKTSVVPYADLEVEAAPNGDLLLTGKTGHRAAFTNWSFGQLASKLECPTNYLQKLPADLTALNLNYGLKNKSDFTDANLLLRGENEDLSVRSITSNRYSRIWNFEIINNLIKNLENNPGWKVPPARPALGEQKNVRPATQEDVLSVGEFGLSIKVGDLIAPAGLYASDHDCFIFMVNEKNRINDGGEGGLSRGFFVSNSEVGAAKFRFTQFLYKHVCGNHIVWGASDINEIAIRHVGDAENRAWGQLNCVLTQYSNESVGGLESQLKVARQKEIAATKEEIFDIIFKSKLLSRKTAEAAYVIAEQNESTDGNPRSYYGYAQGVTRLSQNNGYMDERLVLDQAAGRIIEMAF